MKEHFSVELFNLEEINPNVLRYKIKIAQIGIANNFLFTREVLDEMKATVRGAYILHFYDKQSKDFGGHEDDLYYSNGQLKRTPEPVICGFVDYIQDPWYETCEINGQKVEVLTTYCFIWKDKFPYFSNVEKTYQSMEAEIFFDKKDNNGVNIVNKCILHAVTILGKTVNPAFKLAGLDRFSSELNVMKEEYEIYLFSNKESDDITLKDSKFEQFDYNYAMNIKENFPEIWNKGGNVLGNDSFNNWGKELSNFSNGVYNFSNYKWVKDREEWLSKHERDHLLSDIIAVMKFGGIVSKGESYMKELIDNEKTPITIDNNKESAVNSSEWENPESKLYGKILGLKNSKSLVDEAYLIVESGWEKSPSAHLKYPHHKIKDNKLVLDIKGVESAFQRASAQGIVSGSVKSHLLRHYKELELNVSNFSEKGGNKDLKDKVKAMRKQMKEDKVEKMSSFSDNDMVFVDNEKKEAYFMDEKGMKKFKYADKDDDMDTEDECDCDNKELMSCVSKMMKYKDAEIGKAFSATSSMEAALLEQKKFVEERDAKIENLEKELKGKEAKEKLSKADSLMKEKCFVETFSESEREELMKQLDKFSSYNEFEANVYAVFGQKQAKHFKFSATEGNMNQMYVDQKKTEKTKKVDPVEEIYASLRNKK